MLTRGEGLTLAAALIGAVVTIRITFQLDELKRSPPPIECSLDGFDTLETPIRLSPNDLPTTLRSVWMKDEYKTYEDFTRAHAQKVLTAMRELKRVLPP